MSVWETGRGDSETQTEGWTERGGGKGPLHVVTQAD